MKNLTRQNPRQLIVAQELINKVIKLNYSVAELRVLKTLSYEKVKLFMDIALGFDGGSKFCVVRR